MLFTPVRLKEGVTLLPKRSGNPLHNEKSTAQGSGAYPSTLLHSCDEEFRSYFHSCEEEFGSDITPVTDQKWL